MLLQNEYYGEEIWYDIPQYVYNVKPIYQISNYDRIRNKLTGYILNSWIDNQGYIVYNLRDNNGNAINIHLHRLKMLTFNYIEGCENLTVDHKDCNKQNNSLNNYEWVTRSENTRRACINNLHPVGEDYYNAIFTNDEVEQLCIKLSQGVPISEITKFAEEMIYPRHSPNMKSIIYSILYRESWKSISYKYQFADYSVDTFSDDEVHLICSLLQQGLQYDQILSQMGYDIINMDKDNLNRLRTRLSGIKTGYYYNHISQNYTFPVKETKLISDENVHKICQLIATTDMTNTQILHTVIGVIDDKNQHIKLRRSINEIRKKITHKYISDQYF